VSALVKRDVQGEIRTAIDRILRRDMRTVGLSRHAFKEDAELEALKLTTRDKAIVRSWELPKKLVPFALESSHRRVEALLKAQTEKKATQINVENLTIQLPEKADAALEPIVIDVEAK
jgi:hypothetical protein